jgi:hypothetical protein
MSYGFDRAVLGGLLLYVVATLALALRRPPVDEPEPVLTTSGITERSQDSSEIAGVAHR